MTTGEQCNIQESSMVVVCVIYRQLLEISKKSMSHPKRESINTHLLKERNNVCRENNTREKGSTSFVIKEIQIKTMTYFLSLLMRLVEN